MIFIYSVLSLILIIFFLLVLFLFVIDKKKQKRNIYFSEILLLYRKRIKSKNESEIKRVTQINKKKNERITKLENLIYGSGKKLVSGGIQLPPLDLTNSGIFSKK